MARRPRYGSSCRLFGDWLRIWLMAASLVVSGATQGAPRRIVGNLPSYRAIRPGQFPGLTHLIVFSVKPDPAAGTFKVFSTNAVTGETVFEAPPGGAGLSSAVLDQAVEQAKSFGVRVGLCIGGTGVATQFQDLEIKGTTAAFADYVRDFAVAHALDEINIDWEQPSSHLDAGRATNIFSALCTRLKPEGIELTASWTGSATFPYALEAARLCRPYSDAVYVMSYGWDLASFTNRFLLYTKPESQGGQGYPPEKVCPGVQFFARDSARTLVKTYGEIVDLAGGCANLDPGTNSMVVEGKTLLFTGQTMLGAMCDYSEQTGGGIMIWEIGQDTDPTNDCALMRVLINRLDAARTPTRITAVVDEGSLILSWPMDHRGSRLLVQTNNLSQGISLRTNDWGVVVGSTITNRIAVPITATNRSVFYRLVYP